MTADFKVTFTAEMKCGRCLATFAKEFQVCLYLNYVHGKDPNADAEKVDLRTSEIERMYFSGHNIDLSIGIKEAIVLSIPITSLCDKECKGLCPVCGTNRNIKKCRCKIKDNGLFTPIPAKRELRKKRRKK
ncbi:MAG: DUF177 domain-containing protein [bacterium]